MNETFRSLSEQLILEERERQIKEEGYTREHDLELGGDVVLVQAGHAYYFRDPLRWPFDLKYFKTKNPICDLIRAGALYHAAADLDEFNKRYALERVGRTIIDLANTFYEANRLIARGED